MRAALGSTDDRIAIHVNDTDYEGRTALHVAAARGRTEVVKLLLDEYQASVAIHDSNGHTALHDLARWTNLSTDYSEYVRRTSRAPGAGCTKSICCSTACYLAAILIDFDADLKAAYRSEERLFPPHDDKTPLVTAVMAGHADMVDSLIRHGAGTLLGGAWLYFVYRLNPEFITWLLPVAGALLVSVPLSVISSRVDWGRAARGARLFLIPEEASPPRELRRLRVLLRASPDYDGAFRRSPAT